MPTKHYRNPDATGKAYWLAKGFLPAEAMAFKKITKSAINDENFPALKKMIEARVRFYRKSMKENEGNIRKYYNDVRQKIYFRNGLVTKESKYILYKNDDGVNAAFNLFEMYKQKYNPKDDNGIVVDSPNRRLNKVNNKKGTAKQRAIATAKAEIKRLNDRLIYEKNKYIVENYKRQIQYQQDKIKTLKGG